jgi:hypothetical protein
VTSQQACQNTSRKRRCYGKKHGNKHVETLYGNAFAQKKLFLTYHHITKRTTEQIEMVTTSNFQELEAVVTELSSRLRVAVSAPSKSANKSAETS